MSHWHQIPHGAGREVATELHRLDSRRRLVEQQATLSGAELRLLWLLDDGTPRTLRQIADELDLEQSTVNRQANKAIDAGHLRRFTEPGTVAAHVTPTEQGRERYHRDIALTLRLYEDALESLGPDAATLLDLLTRFVEHYGAAVDDALGVHTGTSAP